MTLTPVVKHFAAELLVHVLVLPTVHVQVLPTVHVLVLSTKVSPNWGFNPDLPHARRETIGGAFSKYI